MTIRVCDLVEYIIHRFLNSGVRSMESPRRLRGQLAEHIPVPQCVQRVKYTIRAHSLSVSFEEDVGALNLVVHPLGDVATRPRLCIRLDETDLPGLPK
ncbi:MAG: hypothetical protein WCC32_08605 [Terriglobales bacterium]